MRGKEAEVVGVAQRGEQRRGGPEQSAGECQRAPRRGRGSGADRGVSCWSAHVCSERSSVVRRRSTDMFAITCLVQATDDAHGVAAMGVVFGVDAGPPATSRVAPQAEAHARTRREHSLYLL